MSLGAVSSCFGLGFRKECRAAGGNYTVDSFGGWGPEGPRGGAVSRRPPYPGSSRRPKRGPAVTLTPLSLFVSCRVQTSQHQGVAFVASR